MDSVNNLQTESGSGAIPVQVSKPHFEKTQRIKQRRESILKLRKDADKNKTTLNIPYLVPKLTEETNQALLES